MIRDDGAAPVQRAILDALPALVAVLDERGVIAFVNTAWRTLAGHEGPDQPGVAVGDDYLAACAICTGEPGAPDALRAVLAGGPPYEVDYVRAGPTSDRWLRMTATHVDGGGVVVMHVDVTSERRTSDERSDLAIRERTARRDAELASAYYRTLFESAPGCYLVLTPADFTVVAVSDAYVRATHLRREQLVGKPLFARDPAGANEAALESFHNLRASMERVRETKRTDAMPVQRYAITKPDGTTAEQYWSPVNHPVLGPHGELAFILHHTEDVSEYMRLRERSGENDISPSFTTREEQLEADIVQRSSELERAHATQAQKRAILRIAGRVARVGGWHYDVRLDRITWSDEIAMLHDEAPGFSPSREQAIAFYAPEHREVIRKAFETCIFDGAPFDLSLHVVTTTGKRLAVRAIGEAVRDPSGRVTAVQGALQDVSEREAADARIETLARRLLETLDALSDGFFTVDAEWRFTYVNPQAERLLHRERAALLGKNLWESFPDAVGTESDVEYHRAVRERVKVLFEQYYPPIDRWLEVEAQPSSEGLAVYFRDVTERRKTREALRESEERFRLLARGTNDAIWDWNVITDHVWWNEGVTTLFGYAQSAIEPTGAWWKARIHPEDAEALEGSLAAHLEGRASAWAREYRFRRQDGTYAVVLDRGHILRDESGKAVRMIGGMTDISDRKEAERRLLEQATLLDKANDAIIVRDLEHQVLYWNRSAERLYGWSAAEVLGRSIRDVLQLDTTAFVGATATTLTKGEWVGELDQVTKDRQTVVVEGRWTLVADDRGRPKSILAIHTDVTQRKKLEAQFLRAQRMESIGALAGGIAHDLNNALAPIIFSASAMRYQETDPEKQQDLDAISTSAERAAAMVRQLLWFARGTEGRKAPTSVAKIAAEVAKIAQDTFPKDIVLRLTLPPDPWSVKADATQLHQLLTNLCVNARDAMPNGGTLTLVVEHVVLDEVYAGMNVDAHPGPYVVIRVEDTGSGMPASILDRIFEPFFTTKELGKGTGLGLSTAHAIVRHHGGFIHVYSEIGVGTRFKVHLPADVSDELAEEVAIQQTALPRGSGELVLVVDDEEAIRAITRRTLERFGYRVALAANGAEAIAVYAQSRGEVAVVLTDMMMPVMDGPATIVALKAIDPHVRIVGSSGLDANGNLAKAVGAGIRHFVPKPYTAETMLRVLAEILRDPS